MRVLLVPIASGALGKNNGTELAPGLLAKHLGFKAETVKIDKSNSDNTHSNIEKAAFSLLKKGKLLSIGGDHSLTYSTLRAFSKRFGKRNAALVLFDAHADCTFFTSAKSHEDYLRALVEEGSFLPNNLLIVGVRHVWKEEKAFLKKKKIKTIEPKAIKKNFSVAIKEVRDFVSSKRAVYVSVDFDVLDSQLAFATGYPEAKGLSKEELFVLLKAAMQSHAQAVDFVEFNPLLDKKNKGMTFAKKIVNFVLQG